MVIFFNFWATISFFRCELHGIIVLRMFSSLQNEIIPLARVLSRFYKVSLAAERELLSYDWPLAPMPAVSERRSGTLNVIGLCGETFVWQTIKWNKMLAHLLKPRLRWFWALATDCSNGSVCVLRAWVRVSSGLIILIGAINLAASEFGRAIRTFRHLWCINRYNRDMWPRAQGNCALHSGAFCERIFWLKERK
jgi:hypothetical protein